ncbi:RloB-like protein [Trichococcus patagoniensis]|uniref:RloB-like protein n=1 Tax=Trichococcus patagoniensis TaxID=382641 RepID=A0A2T5IQ80_9LACT|nr:RloB domain-containing protein [Trichococcus patagoniensis]PTQ85969.1 RloB-like protein [Trichococcus patagoniensis]
MAKIGKKQRKAKRIPEPASYFIGSEGTKTEVLYFKWIADKGWHTAWSNDSFELWYLLHFEYLQSGITREQYKQKLTAHCQRRGIAKYEKNNPLLIEALYPLSKTAIRNASRLEQNYDDWVPTPLYNCSPFGSRIGRFGKEY